MQRRAAGFSLAEMLIVVGVVVLLVALVLVALSGLRGAAAQTSAMSDVRQLVVAYQSYSHDNDQRLMPGYMTKEVFDFFGTTGPQDPGSKMYARLPDGVVLSQFDAGGRGDSSSYVWRLAPHLDYGWRALFTDLHDSAMVDRLQRELDGADPNVISGDEVYGPGTGGATEKGISERPAYGLNSIFLGGDNLHGGDWVTERNPWIPIVPNETIAATRLSQVKHPARVIVFGPAAMADPTGPDVYAEQSPGFAVLTPPFTELISASQTWIKCQWIVGRHGQVERTATGFYGDGAGLPIARHLTDRMPVAMLDGSASVEQISEIARDMTRWSPFEVAQRQTDPAQ